jgi:catechol 2,3-dioxygenase-like lactoylglutathione lyase family enzyme
MPDSSPVPPLRRVLETALYVADLDRAVAFYQQVMGLRVLFDGSPRLVALDGGEGTVLLLFQQGTTAEGLQSPGGWIPPHHATGPAHVAFAVPEGALDEWERHLRGHGVAVESRVQWSGGGWSLYFRDPDGHSVELATPGTWPSY